VTHWVWENQGFPLLPTQAKRLMFSLLGLPTTCGHLIEKTQKHQARVLTFLRPSEYSLVLENHLFERGEVFSPTSSKKF